VLKYDELPVHYLARNMEVVKNVEGDSQKTLRLFKEYTTLAAKTGGSAGVKKWVENLAKGNQHALQVFQCATDLRFFTILNIFGNAFHNKPVFSVKYVRQHLHGLCGGVSFFLPMVGTLQMKPFTDHRRGTGDHGENHSGYILQDPELRDQQGHDGEPYQRRGKTGR
jgi:hypothetical protein